MDTTSKASHSNPPSLTLRQAELSWFVHDGKAYSVASCDSTVFKDAIRAAMDAKRLSALSGALQDIEEVLSGDLDLFARWWLLCTCGLRSTKSPMTLYASRGEAEHALGSVN